MCIYIYIYIGQISGSTSSKKHHDWSLYSCIPHDLIFEQFITGLAWKLQKPRLWIYDKASRRRFVEKCCKFRDFDFSFQLQNLHPFHESPR